VAQRFRFNQSTVSRHQRKCSQAFGVAVRKMASEWHVVGDTRLLNLERRVHQHARFQGQRPLRLEATYWSGPLLCTPPPQGWMLGLCNIVGVARNVQLVRERIVDAWLCGLPDLPDPEDPDLTAIVLSTMPVHCTVAEGHPLLRQNPLELEQLADFPSLALPEGAYPKVEQGLKAMGLWSTPVRMDRYQRDRWEGLTESAATIGYATALSLEVCRDPSGRGQVILPITLPFHSGEAVVVRREFAASPQIQILIQLVRTRLQPYCEHYPEIRLVS
jgi:hypothetical protein